MYIYIRALSIASIELLQNATNQQKFEVRQYSKSYRKTLTYEGQHHKALGDCLDRNWSPALRLIHEGRVRNIATDHREVSLGRINLPFGACERMVMEL